MKYLICYSCVSDVGKIRSINQDNFVCDGKYLDANDPLLILPLTGAKKTKKPLLFGVFDGMGGEECGEVASLIAAQTALEIGIGPNPTEDLLTYCIKANEKICEYIKENNLYAMGTTAALIAFTKTGIALCNIGDTKIFRFSGGKLDQLSEDHYSYGLPGRKPPLSQSLGTPPEEFLIEPFVTTAEYREGDIYLICSDGLTDMVPVDAIKEILTETKFEDCSDRLLKTALDNGGRDNTTILLCKVERKSFWLFDRIFRTKNTKTEKEAIHGEN